VQNYHCAEKGLNMSLTLRRPAAGAVDELQCISCPVAHSLAGRIAIGNPVVFVLSDQNFPAMVPAGGGGCMVIVRVEDGTLSEIEGAFADRLRAHLRPHGSIPAGSVILVGSLSHLRARGLVDYADSLVKTMGVLVGKVGPGIEVAPLVNIPMHHVDSPSLVRAMMDLDGWILEDSSGSALPKTRKKFWDVVTRGCTRINLQQDSFTVMMPVGLRNHRKRPLTSDPFSTPIPATIPPFDEGDEGEVIQCMIHEINELHGLKLDTEPNFSRGTEPIATNGKNRTVILGASHMHRVATVLAAEAGGQVTDLTSPGWIPTKEAFKKASDCVAELGLDSGDLLILDIWSNSSFLGTDEVGLPIRAVRGGADGRYHIIGPLQVAPKSVFKKILEESRPILEAAGEAMVVLVSPFPRYVQSTCCPDPSHISNFGTEEYRYEFEGLREMVESVVSESGVAVSIFTLNDTWDHADRLLHELRTDNGGPVWLDDDPVHLTREAYVEIANALLMMRGGGGGSEDGDHFPPAKRRRLESVVTGQRGTATRGRLVKPPPWVAGLEATPNRGRGRGWNAGYGGRGGGGRGGGRGVWPAGGFRGGVLRPYGGQRGRISRGGRGGGRGGWNGGGRGRGGGGSY
jgi:hypothetical protein